MEYLITPPSETNWQFNQSNFITNLVNKYSNIQIKLCTNPNDYYCFEGLMKVAGNGQMLEIALHRDMLSCEPRWLFRRLCIFCNLAAIARSSKSKVSVLRPRV